MRIKRRPPTGYKVIDADAWNASQSELSDNEIRELGDGGLARCGLARVKDDDWDW